MKPLSSATRSSPSGEDDAHGETATASPTATAREAATKAATGTRRRAPAGASSRGSRSKAIRSGREADHGGDRRDGHDRLAHADQRVHPEHRRQDGAERDGARDAQLDRGRRGADHDRQPGARGGDRQQRRAAAGQRPVGPEHQPADDEPAEHAHVEDVRPERGYPAVGEQEGLEDQHDGQHHPRHPRSEEQGGQRRAEEVPARAARHGEVEHLGGEDERARHPQQGKSLVVEVDLRAPEPVADREARRDRGRDGDLGGQEPVRDVHARLPRSVTRRPARADRPCGRARRGRRAERRGACRRRPATSSTAAPG